MPRFLRFRVVVGAGVLLCCFGQGPDIWHASPLVILFLSRLALPRLLAVGAPLALMLLLVYGTFAGLPVMLLPQLSALSPLSFLPWLADHADHERTLVMSTSASLW